MFTATAAIAACTAPPPAPSASPSASARAATATATAAAGLDAAIPATIATDRRWYTIPDGVFADEVVVTATFDADPRAGAPSLRISTRDVPLAPTADARVWTARVALLGWRPGEHRIELLERVRGAPATVQAGPAFMVSAAEYAVWTLDFEGDAAGDAEMANAAAIADALRVPMTVMWNPRAWTTAQVGAERAEAMLAWTKGRLAKGDEVALHLHMWTDYVRAAGSVPRLVPSWAGRSDGYDVPITAYPADEQRRLIAYGVRLMEEHGLPRPTSFRGGGQFADAGTLRGLADLGFNADCSAVIPAGSFGRLQLPWRLAGDAQPYRPARDDANVPGDLPLLESPTNGGNTYAFDARTIQPQVRTNASLLAAPGQVAEGRRTLHVVSHPGTIVPAERAAIEALFHALDPLRYDADRGPLRFVTLRQLAKAHGL